jgi:hypothetical protein
MEDVFLSYVAEVRAKIAKQRAKLDAEEYAINQSEKHYKASGAANLNQGQVQEEVLQNNNEASNRAIQSSAETLGEMNGAVTYNFPPNLTIKSRVIAILRKHPDGLTSRQILSILQSTGLPSIWRETLSPQLSRLKIHDQVIDAKDGVWFMKKDIGDSVDDLA